MEQLLSSLESVWKLVESNWWMLSISVVGIVGFIIYRSVDFLQTRYVAKQPKPEDLKISQEIYDKKRQRKTSRSSRWFLKGVVSWLMQVGFIALIPFFITLIYGWGVSFGIIYIILMVASFILNLLLSKLFPLWSPARPFACRAYEHESVWNRGNVAMQAWGVASWGIPVYFLWDYFQVNGWIGSVIFIVIAQLIQVFIFIYAIKKQAIPYQKYDGFSKEFKDSMHKYLESQGMRDDEVGVLAGVKMGPNAFATGLFGYRQIVITEELIKGYQDPTNPDFILKLGEDTIEAITAHEVGHIKYSHVPKSLALGMFITSAVTIAVYFLFSSNPQSYVSTLHADTTTQLMLYWGQSIFNIMFVYPITFLMLSIGRGNEYQADTHLLETNGCKNGQDFFHQIRHIAPVSNLPAWHNCNATHPPAKDREDRMNKWSEEHCKDK